MHLPAPTNPYPTTVASRGASVLLNTPAANSCVSRTSSRDAVLLRHVRRQHVRGGVCAAHLVIRPGLGDASPLLVVDHDLEPRALRIHHAAGETMTDVEVAERDVDDGMLAAHELPQARSPTSSERAALVT